MTVRDVNTFLSAISAARGGKTDTVFFRGHGNEEYKSLPKVFRNPGWTDSEEKLLRGILEMHPEEFSNDQTTLERLVRAQHFGLPTRLLDVSLNPLVALYFCCRDKTDKNGEVVLYFVGSDRIKTFDSDTMSVIANSALLKRSEKKKIDSAVTAHFGHKETLTISEFNKMAPLPRLLHFIQSEKPYFQPKIKLQAFRQYVAVLPKRNNRRMIAQSGAFIAFATNRTLKTGLSPRVDIKSITIPARFKDDLLRQLDDLNINQGSLFPDVSSAAEYLSEKYDIPF
jgi:hypothetical protein